MALIRLDKFLTMNGCGTRSEVKKLLKSGTVTMNGIPIKKPESKVDPTKDCVTVSGRELVYEPFLCLMFHKPAGCITATSDRRQKTVMDFIEHDRRDELFPVGRLDIDTEGMLLVMNDGDLAHRMLSPKYHVEKTYFARVEGRVDETDIQAFAEGIDIGEKQLTLPAKLRILRVYSEHTMDTQKISDDEKSGKLCREQESLECPSVFSEIELTICEGKFHQVKRMFSARGKQVVYLKRISMAGIILDEQLMPGEWRKLTEEELGIIKRYRNDIREQKSSDF